MPSSAKATNFWQSFETWNRKVHYYLGLYFLFFLWLFLLTGLMLNHGAWRISRAANQRIETKYERAVEPPNEPGELDRARDLMSQLGLVGEIEFPPAAAARQSGHFDFNVARP